MPPESLWIQYSLIGILILAAGLIAAAFYRLWHELLAWIEKQDQKRDDERDKQRTWEALQKKESDERWQFFLKRQQEQWLTQDLNQTVILSKLIDKTDLLISAVNNHDTWARAQNQNGK